MELFAKIGGNSTTDFQNFREKKIPETNLFWLISGIFGAEGGI